MRDALGRVQPHDLTSSLHALVLAAHRRKALRLDLDLPFGIASMDGKGFSIPGCDDFYAQRQTRDEGAPLVGVVRTITVTLTSSAAKPCIDVMPIAASTNEMGSFRHALDQLVQTYGHLDLFRLVTYDAGACSLDNANAVREQNLHYLFGLKATQPTLYNQARLWLRSRTVDDADAKTEDIAGPNTVVRRIYIGSSTAEPEGWTHLRTVLRVESETFDPNGNRIAHEDRYFLSSLATDRLTPEQWLSAVRAHWGVETTHQILDVSFKEDDHPWIESEPRAALVVAILRRIVYTMLALFRSVTQRSDGRRATPWRILLEDIHDSLLTLADHHLHGLRRRKVSPLPALN
jgi:predicted transposase YbfD/YdcC